MAGKTRPAARAPANGAGRAGTDPARPDQSSSTSSSSDTARKRSRSSTSTPPADRPGTPPPREPSRSAPAMPAVVDDGAGFVLGLLVWGWVILPFLKNGVAGVRNTLRAKFFNKAADGSWLP